MWIPYLLSAAHCHIYLGIILRTARIFLMSLQYFCLFLTCSQNRVTYSERVILTVSCQNRYKCLLHGHPLFHSCCLVHVPKTERRTRTQSRLRGTLRISDHYLIQFHTVLTHSTSPRSSYLTPRTSNR
jgi:hypothetical protein